MILTDKIQVFNEDCMETMNRYPDKYFDLAIVDPPYGLQSTGNLSRMNGAGKLKGRAMLFDNNKKDSDNVEGLF